MDNAKWILEEIGDIVAKRIVYLATVDESGVPNVIPIGGKKMIEESKILIVDVRLNRTKRNILKNPHVALIVEDLTRRPPRSYQVKGTALYFEDGMFYEEAKMLSDLAWSAGKRSGRVRYPVRGAVVVTIDAVYCNMRGGLQVLPPCSEMEEEKPPAMTLDEGSL